MIENLKSSQNKDLLCTEEQGKDTMQHVSTEKQKREYNANKMTMEQHFQSVSAKLCLVKYI